MSRAERLELAEIEQHLTEAANCLIRIELVVYESGGGRTGPIIINDGSRLDEFANVLRSIKRFESTEHPHALFTTEDEVFITLVYDEIANAHARVVGPMFFFFD